MGLGVSGRSAAGAGGQESGGGSSSWVDALQAAGKTRVPGGVDAMEAKGDKLVAQAWKELRGFWSHVEPAKDRHGYAARYFGEAGDAFKLAKNWRKAASAYHESAICYMKIGREERIEAAQSLWDAAKCYKKSFNPDDKEFMNKMEWTLQIVIRMLVLENELSVAGSACEELAELYAAQKQRHKAREFYEKAAEYYGKTTDPFCTARYRQSALEKATSCC
ncbi:hypothetical protein ACP70R_036572 [Stipagrostis hirtigluma subsp. patula]